MTLQYNTVFTDNNRKSARSRTRLADAVIPAGVAVFLWNVLGVNNIESGVHIDYSLGSSMPWHGWFTRGQPGEVIRWLGVPIYDQWSGLGYRLPTQGSLTSLPSVYLARYFPLNLVVTTGWLLALTFMFILVHQWIAKWSDEYSSAKRIFADISIIGVMSFYTLWHGWQQYPLQIAGAIVCLVSVLDKDLIENPQGAELLVRIANFSVGIVLLILPHYGFAMTFLPAVLILSCLVIVRRRGTIVRRIYRCPLVLTPLSLSAIVVLPGALDLHRELSLQSALPSVSPESGVLHYTYDVGNFDLSSVTSWLSIGLTVLHTMIFPLFALIRPETYLELLPGDPRSIFQIAWSHNRTQFGGGLLAATIALWSLIHPKRLQASVIERFIGVIILGSLLIGIFNMTHPVGQSGLRWVLELKMIPGSLLSNSRWQYADLSAVLTLLLFVWQDHKMLGSRKNSCSYKSSVKALRNLVVIIGVSVFALLLPYRALETVRLNQGQTRFSPLQLDSKMRNDNEQWRRQVVKIREELFHSSDTSPQRVLIPARETNAQDDIFTGLEGHRSWWGLRVHAQLRDVQLSSLASKPKIRSSLTLEKRTKQTQLAHDVWNFACDTHIRSRLDFLSVAWGMFPRDCAIHEFSDFPQIELPMPSDWSRPNNRKSNAYATEFRLASSEGDFVALRNLTFSHWWIQSGTRSDTPCSVLTADCLSDLRSTRSQNQPPLELCHESCVATYRLSGEVPTDMRLLIPLNYDPTLKAEQSGVDLRIEEFRGLVAIDSKLLSRGTIRISVRPDRIMKFYGLSPIVSTLLFSIAVATNSRSSKLSRRLPKVLPVSQSDQPRHP